MYIVIVLNGNEIVTTYILNNLEHAIRMYNQHVNEHRYLYDVVGNHMVVLKEDIS